MQRSLYKIAILFLLLAPVLGYSQSWVASGLANEDVSYILQLKVTGYLLAGTRTGVYRSTDKGKTWKQPLNVTGLTASGWELVADDAGNLFGHNNMELMGRSLDAGAHWQVTTEQDILQAMGGVLNYIFMTNEGSIFASTSGSLRRSNDQAVNWTKIGQGLDEENPDIRAMGEGLTGSLFAGSAGVIGGNIYRSDDNGETFTQVYTGEVNHDVLSIGVTPAGSILASINDKGIFRSTDNGSSWSPVTTDLGADGTPSAFMSRGNEIVGFIYNIGIYGSKDDGQTWYKISDLPSESQTYTICVTKDGNILAATTNGILKLTATDGITPTHSIADITLKYHRSGNQLITTVQSPHQTIGNVTLLDLLGRTRAVIFDGVLGENSTSFITNISSLESGMYLLNVTTPLGSSHERMLITH